MSDRENGWDVAGIIADVVDGDHDKIISEHIGILELMRNSEDWMIMFRNAAGIQSAVKAAIYPETLKVSGKRPG